MGKSYAAVSLRTFLCAPLIALLFSLAACDDGNGLAAAQDADTGLPGLIDKDGNWVAEPEFSR